MCFIPAGAALAELAAVAALRWTIEECFQRTKTDLGLDHCEAHSWHGWHRHMSLVMAAAAFLAKLAADLRRAAMAGSYIAASKCALKARSSNSRMRRSSAGRKRICGVLVSARAEVFRIPAHAEGCNSLNGPVSEEPQGKELFDGSSSGRSQRIGRDTERREKFLPPDFAGMDGSERV